jgi:hypothetical protein
MGEPKISFLELMVIEKFRDNPSFFDDIYKKAKELKRDNPKLYSKTAYEPCLLALPSLLRKGLVEEFERDGNFFYSITRAANFGLYTIDEDSALSDRCYFLKGAFIPELKGC